MAVRRRKSTSRKSIRLTDDGRVKIQTWADEQGVSFSAAIESLCLLGMGEPAAVAFAPFMVSAVRFKIQRLRIPGPLQRVGRLHRIRRSMSNAGIDPCRAILMSLE